MADSVYKFIVAGELTNPTAIPNTVPNTTGLSDETAASSDFFEGAVGRASKAIVQQTVLSPLNQVTGGLATPAYGLGKALITGAKAGAVGGAFVTIAIKGIQIAINAMEQRMSRLENEAQQANNRDNLLIRAGFKMSATNYEANFFKGVVSTAR